MAWPREFRPLHEIGWLAETPEAFRGAVLGRCTPKRYGRGDLLYRAGDPPGGLYGLIEGGVGIELSPDDREPYFGIFARPGFWIGEGSVLTRGPRFIGVRATRESLLAHLPLTQWDAVVQADPEAWRWFAHLCLRNTLLAVAVADALMIPGATERLAAVLVILAGLGEPAAAGASIGISHDALARMANLSRSSTGRILQAFEADGLVACGYREIRIVDPGGLQERRVGARSAPTA